MLKIPTGMTDPLTGFPAFSFAFGEYTDFMANINISDCLLAMVMLQFSETFPSFNTVRH